jgi:hypothetical protein
MLIMFQIVLAKGHLIKKMLCRLLMITETTFFGTKPITFN